MRGGHNFIGKSQIGPQIGNTSIGQIAVIVLPAEGDADVFTRFKGFHQHEDFQVGGSFNLRMGRSFGVLLDDANSFLEEVAEDSNAVFLGDKHDGSSLEERMNPITGSACRILEQTRKLA